MLRSIFRSSSPTNDDPNSKSRLRTLSSKLRVPSIPSPPKHSSLVNAITQDGRRQAALRERGLLPPLSGNDLSKLEHDRDQRLAVALPPESQHQSQFETDAERIMKEWKAKQSESDNSKLPSEPLSAHLGPSSPRLLPVIEECSQDSSPPTPLNLNKQPEFSQFQLPSPPPTQDSAFSLPPLTNDPHFTPQSSAKTTPKLPKTNPTTTPPFISLSPPATPHSPSNPPAPVDPAPTLPSPITTSLSSPSQLAPSSRQRTKSSPTLLSSESDSIWSSLLTPPSSFDDAYLSGFNGSGKGTAAGNNKDGPPRLTLKLNLDDIDLSSIPVIVESPIEFDHVLVPAKEDAHPKDAEVGDISAGPDFTFALVSAPPPASESTAPPSEVTAPTSGSDVPPTLPAIEISSHSPPLASELTLTSSPVLEETLPDPAPEVAEPTPTTKVASPVSSIEVFPLPATEITPPTPPPEVTPTPTPASEVDAPTPYNPPTEARAWTVSQPEAARRSRGATPPLITVETIKSPFQFFGRRRQQITSSCSGAEEPADFPSSPPQPQPLSPTGTRLSGSTGRFSSLRRSLVGGLSLQRPRGSLPALGSPSLVSPPSTRSFSPRLATFERSSLLSSPLPPSSSPPRSASSASYSLERDDSILGQMLDITLHNSESLILNASKIKDEESRRLSEMAFLM